MRNLKKIALASTAVFALMAGTAQAATWTVEQIKLAKTNYMNTALSTSNLSSFTDERKLKIINTYADNPELGDYSGHGGTDAFMRKYARTKVRAKFNEDIIAVSEEHTIRHRNYRNVRGTRPITRELGCDNIDNQTCTRTTSVRKNRVRNGKYYEADFIITNNITNPNYIPIETQVDTWNSAVDTRTDAYRVQHRYIQRFVTDVQFDVLAPASVAHSEGYTGKGAVIDVLDYHTGEGSHGDVVSSAVRTIAPGANIRNRPFQERGFFDRSKDADIVNISQGSTRGRGAWRNYIGRKVGGSALVVVAAGNNAETCSTASKCNQIALAANDVRSTLVVGLQGHDGKIHSQSARAGILKDRFILAPTISKTPYNLVYGTSFAAPVVSGAVALLMDKFNVNSSKAANALLATATDIGAPGVDEINGHGVLNLRKALSPIGKLR